MAIDDARTRLEWRDFSELSTGRLYELLRLRQAIFVVEQRSPYADLDGLDQQSHHLLLHIDNTLAGYLRLIPLHGENCVAVGRVAIAADWRRQGLAQRLVETALGRCTDTYSGYTVTLSAQAYLVPFYERLGFHTVSAPYDDCGVPHIDMVLVKGEPARAPRTQ